MNGRIVTCDLCGAHGRAHRNAAAPDHWFFARSVARAKGGARVHFTHACSARCALALWERGPGPGLVDEAEGSAFAPADRARVPGLAELERQIADLERQIAEQRARAEQAERDRDEYRAVVEAGRGVVR